ncbi:CoxG family protein [Janibacter sp. Soil728]|uniref:CoxG family protein n=1 Tax=Janibacter sp. Soil728 TaxID=1736393 RepID=UPI000A7F6180|nr:SRPBCC family protein [Janibacter sp. Soil728]
MQIDHTLTIHADIDQVWPLLQRPETVVECLPGVTLTSLDGEAFTGKMSVGLGPMRLNYGGEGTLRYDEPARAIHIGARGNEARGAGSAAATVDISVLPGAEGSTRIDVSMELDLQGKPAQFGRGILAEVITRLATQFGKNLERRVADTSSQGLVDAAGSSAEPLQASGAPVTARGPVGSAPVSPSTSGRQLVALAAAALVGAAATALIGSRRSVHVTIVAGDAPEWIELARDLVRGH